MFAIAFLLMLSQISCAANDASEDSSSMRDKIAALFTSSRVIALKYRPVSQLGPAPPTEQQLIEHWIYSASMNCVGDCGKKAKELQQYLASGKQADSACPPPFSQSCHSYLQIDQVRHEYASTQVDTALSSRTNRTFLTKHSQSSW